MKFDDIIEQAHRVTNLATLPPKQVDRDVQSAITRAGGLVQAVNELAIRDGSELETMGGLRVEVQTALKALEEKRADLLAPMKEAQDRIREFFRPPITALGDAKLDSGLKMGNFKRAIEEKERKARAETERKERAQREVEVAKLRAKAEKEAEKGREQTAAALRDAARDVARAPAAAPPPKTTETKTEGTHYRKVYTVIANTEAIMLKLATAIDDFNAKNPQERILGAENFLVNERLLQRTAEATKGAVTIPDVRIDVTEVPVTRSRRR